MMTVHAMSQNPQVFDCSYYILTITPSSHTFMLCWFSHNTVSLISVT